MAPNTYVYKVRSSTTRVKSFKLRLAVAVDACTPGTVAQIQATFYPLGRQVPSCAIRQTPTVMTIAANRKKCTTP